MINLIETVSVCSIIIIILMICIQFIKKVTKKNDINTKLDEWIEKNKKRLFIIILTIGILVRVVEIGNIPKGLHIDEAGMAYDSYCIAKYGTDRYGEEHPLYFTNFGQGQSALCTYITSIFVGIFGINTWAIRLPIATISILAMITMYFLVKKFKNTKMAIIFLFLMAINPWHIMQARWGLDCNLLSSFLVFSIFAFSKAKSPLGYIGAGIVIGITLYTYALSYIIIPIFLAMTLVYLLYLKKITWKNIIFLGIPIFIFALPLIYMILLNNHIVPKINIPFFSIPELPMYRIGEISIKNIKENLYLPIILFFGDNMIYNVPDGFGTLYYISIPFTIIGLLESIINVCKNIKEKKFNFDCIMLFQFIASVICMLIIIEPKVNKANAIFIPMIYFTMIGIVYFSKEFPKLLWLLVALYIIHFIIFEVYYFYEFKNNIDSTYNTYFDDSIEEITDYINKQDKYKDKKVHMELRTHNSSYYKKEPYIYTLISNKMKPEEFKNSIRRNSGNKLSSYDKYYFYNIQEYNYDTVYVLKYPSENLIQEFEERNFLNEKVGDYIIYYYP